MFFFYYMCSFYDTLNRLSTKVQQRRKDSIKGLLVACKEAETKYVIRTLQGKMRLGIADQAVIAALARALVLTPPLDAAPPPGKDDALQQALADATQLLKNVYSECPSWDLIVPAILEHGLNRLPEFCHVTPGVPLQPMLAKPTKVFYFCIIIAFSLLIIFFVKNVSEILDRFQDCAFTCEFKYDGERAQVCHRGRTVSLSLSLTRTHTLLHHEFHRFISWKMVSIASTVAMLRITRSSIPTSFPCCPTLSPTFSMHLSHFLTPRNSSSSLAKK